MRTIILLTFLALSLASYASESKDNQPAEEKSDALPMYYVSNIPNKEFLEKLQQQEFFANSKEKLYGSPIYFRATIQNRNTAGGEASSLFSIMLAGGSLGIIPIVSNKDFILRYEMLVNGEKIFDHQFIYNMTDARNLFSGPGGNEMDKEILAWANTTIPEILALIEKDPKIIALVKEYKYYFADKK